MNWGGSDDLAAQQGFSEEQSQCYLARGLVSRNKEVIVPMHCALVQSPLKCCAVLFWKWHFRKGTEKLDSTQRKVTRAAGEHKLSTDSSDFGLCIAVLYKHLIPAELN